MNLKEHQSVVGTDTPVVVGSVLRNYINLDNAASTPAFQSVLEAVNEFIPLYSSVHRGNGFKSRLSTEAYDAARRVVGDFVGASRQDHVVIFGKNTTEAINTLAYRLPLTKKDIVIISHLEHHSNDLPWRARATVVRIAMTPQGSIDQEDFTKLLQKYSGRVALVAITGASNVTGHLPDIHWFARHAHAAGARIMIDCAQLAAHRHIRMGKLDEPDHIDYVALSGHKMYAPFGTGALIGRRDTFTHGEPVLRGGGTVDVVTPHNVDWTNPPERDEAGSPNVVGAVAMAQAIATLREIGLPHIAAHEDKLTRTALDVLAKIPGLTIYGPSKSRSGIIAFTIRDIPCQLIAAILGYEWGIGVRSGCFCAQPYVMSLLGVDEADVARIRTNVAEHHKGVMPGMVRISFGLYNTKEDIRQLAEALRAITEGDYGDYRLNKMTGEYTPNGNTPIF